MTAKEMFERLGYKQHIDCYGYIIYEKIQENDFKIIRFTNKEVDINEGDEYHPNLSVDELQAINQQCKELGWFDEN